jgi:hypothetical protein
LLPCATSPPLLISDTFRVPKFSVVNPFVSDRHADVIRVNPSWTLVKPLIW